MAVFLDMKKIMNDFVIVDSFSFFVAMFYHEFFL